MVAENSDELVTRENSARLKRSGKDVSTVHRIYEKNIFTIIMASGSTPIARVRVRVSHFFEHCHENLSRFHQLTLTSVSL